MFGEVDELAAAAGSRLGVSPWLRIERARVELFADATDDHDWAAGGGVGVAHGFLTMSLLPRLVGEVYQVAGARLAVNYGLDRLRFTAPVPVGALVRAVVDLDEVTEVADAVGQGVQLHTTVVVELDGSVRPAMIAKWITRLYR